MPAEEHDAAVAAVSHVPQVAASLVAARLRDLPTDAVGLSGQGVRDVTRIAGSDPGLWRQILVGNREAVRQELAGVRADLDELLTVLDDPDALEAFLARGRAGARSLPGKHGRDRADFVTLTLEIPDAPGALARLFADIGQAGINVEDIAIEHDPSRELGYLAVAVDEAAAERLMAAMGDAGWVVRGRDA